MKGLSVLLVEDDPGATREIAAVLEGEGWSVVCAADGAEGLREAAVKRFDLIVADRSMPNMDGHTMLGRLRELGVVTPAIILSALGETTHRIEGLNAGADDYLPKPFDGAELIARVRALLRRTGFNRHNEVMLIGDLEIWINSQTAVRNGRPLDLAPREYRLLKYLADNAGQPVTQRMILENVFQWTAAQDPGTGVVPVSINRLRAKLDRPEKLEMLKTVRGTGYMLVDPATHVDDADA